MTVGEARARPIEWATRTLTQGEALDTFAEHCRVDLDDVEVVAQTPARIELDWRGGRERSAVALRTGAVVPEPEPLLLLGEIEPELVARFLDDGDLRARVAIYDLARLEKVNAVRSSSFVYFEWFLRDVYGVKVLPPNAFTQGLVERGIISLGMG